MYTQNAILFLAAAGAATASVLNERMPFGAIDARSVVQGWSLQASSAPDGTTSCGSGAYCPSSLKCNQAATAEVAACCTSGDCRGTVEGAPVCADSAWSLWKGRDGNGFCCVVGDVGSYVSGQSAGTCGKDVPGGATSAVIMTTGSGSAPASQTSSSPSSASAADTTASAAVTSAASVASSASSAASSVASSAATSAAAASSSAATAANSTGSAATPKPSGSGAERLASGFAAIVLAFGAVLAL